MRAVRMVENVTSNTAVRLVKRIGIGAKGFSYRSFVPRLVHAGVKDLKAKSGASLLTRRRV